jgi:hypothetical protein
MTRHRAQVEWLILPSLISPFIEPVQFRLFDGPIQALSFTSRRAFSLRGAAANGTTGVVVSIISWLHDRSYMNSNRKVCNMEVVL